MYIPTCINTVRSFVVCTYIHTYVCTYVCTYVRMYVQYEHMYVRINVCMYVSVRMHKHTYVCMYVPSCSCNNFYSHKFAVIQEIVPQ